MENVFIRGALDQAGRRGLSFLFPLCSVFPISSGLFKGEKRVFFCSSLNVFCFASSHTLLFLFATSGFQNWSVLLQALARRNDLEVLWSFLPM